MDHLVFLIINFFIFFIILYLDKKNVRNYLYIAGIGLILAFIFENVTIASGFWLYHSEPKILLVSLYTWLLYVPYLGFCYFAANKVRKYV